MSNKIKIVGIAGIMVANIAYTTTYIAGIPQHSQTVTYQEHRMSGSYDLSLFPLDTVFSFKTKGTWPAGVAWDGAYLWLSDYDSLKIWKLDTLGNIISAFPNPAGATSFGCSGELAYDRANLWFVSEQSGKIFKLNPFNCSIVAVFNVPDYTSSDPNTFGVTWDGKYLWVSKYSTDAKIYKLRPSDGAPIDSFTPPNDGILAIEYLDGYIYGVDASGEKIYKMNPNNGTVVDSTEWSVPYALGIAWNGTCWWGISSMMPWGKQRLYKLCGWPGVEEHYKSCSVVESYPNPAVNGTYIEYTLPKETPVTIDIFNIMGNRIRNLSIGYCNPGKHIIYLTAIDNKGNKLPAGLYFYRISAENLTLFNKFIIAK